MSAMRSRVACCAISMSDAMSCSLLRDQRREDSIPKAGIDQEETNAAGVPGRAGRAVGPSLTETETETEKYEGNPSLPQYPGWCISDTLAKSKQLEKLGIRKKGGDDEKSTGSAVLGVIGGRTPGPELSRIEGPFLPRA